MSVVCRRCRHHFDPGERHVEILYLPHPVRDGFFHLCGECTDALRTWLGLAPEIEVPYAPPFPVAEETAGTARPDPEVHPGVPHDWDE